MIKEKWEQVLEGKEVRQNLSKIRQELKNQDCRELLLDIVKEDSSKIIALLDAEDAKTRKNTALLMGDLGEQEFLTPVWRAYQKEQQRFVKSAYLNAIGNFDYRKYLDEMKAQLDVLRKTEITEDSQKHIREEMRELSALIVRIEGVAVHSFTGWNEPYDVILLTNRNFTEQIKDELISREPNAKTRLFSAGIMAKVENLKWVKEIRTYQELLFIIKGMESCKMDPVQVADAVMNSQLLSFLYRGHEGEPPYYFRIEMKSKRDLAQRSDFVKKLSAEIESRSDRKLINTTQNYEFELRLIENKQGKCNIMIKLYTLKDKRFSYREEAIAASIRPVNAALTAALAKEYLKEDAQVLDPFCGVGTMLIERNKLVRANTTYGIDIQEEAILKARKNTEAAKQIIHYINRDFFQFQHEYLFDEIFTNLPFQIGRLTDTEVFEIYERFFRAAPKYLKKGAVLVLYSHNKGFVRKLIAQTGYRLLEEYEISKKEGTYVIVLRYM